MTPKQAYSYFGGQTAIARLLNLSRQAVDNWGRRKRIPLHHQIELNHRSEGKLVVTMRPTVRTRDL